jgi:AcrR family transcriptional regulator
VAEERFAITELVSRTGVPAATVHHYRRLGLLPAPRRAAANRFLYDVRHVQALRLIKTLRDRRALPLEVIRRVLPDLLGLTEEEAFRPEMWDEAVGRRATGGRRSPRARLLAAAMDAFSRRGYADVAIDDICRAAGVAKGSFYRHYRSKEEVFFAAAQAVADEVAQAFTEGTGAPIPVPSEKAAALLGRAIEPRLLIFLDLIGRAAGGRPGNAQVLRRILDELAMRVGRATGHEDEATAGTALLQRALSLAVWSVVQPSPAAATGATLA